MSKFNREERASDSTSSDEDVMTGPQSSSVIYDSNNDSECGQEARNRIMNTGHRANTAI